MNEHENRAGSSMKDTFHAGEVSQTTTGQVRTSDIKKFIAYVEGRVKAQDRGVLADLRRGISATTEHRAWPHLARWCDLTDERQRMIWQTVAAGLAICGSTARCGSIGHTLRHIAMGSGEGKKEALNSFDARFRRLLTCSKIEELCGRLPPIIKVAERTGIPVDFERLFWDLQMWEGPKHNIKLKWAADYWGVPPVEEKQNEEGGDSR